MSESERNVLLIVDDESSVCRVLRHVLAPKFDAIACAQTPADADTILASREVTHIICDLALGPGQPSGMELARKWREEHPSVRRIIILTGACLTGVETDSAVDFVLGKTTSPHALADYLGV